MVFVKNKASSHYSDLQIRSMKAAILDRGYSYLGWYRPDDLIGYDFEKYMNDVFYPSIYKVSQLRSHEIVPVKDFHNDLIVEINSVLMECNYGTLKRNVIYSQELQGFFDSIGKNSIFSNSVNSDFSW